jgi:DNA-binding transcriptional regulator/RsmH inhibitor MraZ
LREFAGIEGEAVVAGMYDHLEIWSVAKWEAQRQLIEDPEDDSYWEDLGF